MKLPEGWTHEDIYDGRCCLLHSAPPERYMATIDWEERCVRSGLMTRGPAISDKKYGGRGWREAIVLDAVAHLQGIVDSYCIPNRIR